MDRPLTQDDLLAYAQRDPRLLSILALGQRAQQPQPAPQLGPTPEQLAGYGRAMRPGSWVYGR